MENNDNSLEIVERESLESMTKNQLIDAYMKQQSQLLELVSYLKNLSLRSSNLAAILRKYNVNRFIGNSDNSYLLEKGEKEERKENKAAEENREAKQRGRKAGTKNFALLDLEKLSQKHDPIILDPLESLPEEERRFYAEVAGEVSYSIDLPDLKETEILLARKMIRKCYKDRRNGSFLKEPSHAPIPGSPAGPNLLADVLFAKYGLGVPDYSYARWLAKAGFLPATPSLLYGWTAGAATALSFVYREICDGLRKAGCVHIDETPVRTLDAEDRINGYVFVFSAVVDGRKLRCYRFSQERKIDVVWEVLGHDFTGCVVTDACPIYDILEGSGIPHQLCNVHALREFKDVLKGMPAKARKGSDAERIVREYQAVLGDEEVIRQIGPKTPEERVSLRQDPGRLRHLSDLFDDIRKTRDRYAKGTPMYKACQYCLNHEKGLRLYTTEGRVPADNSEAERTVKPYALSRRRFLFVRAENGGQASAVATTLIQTAAENGYEPREYLARCLSAAWRHPQSGSLPWEIEGNGREGK